MRSRLYTGKILHARSWPVKNRFQYPVYFYAFDIDELEELDKKVLFFGHNRFHPVALHDRDYLTPGPDSLRDKLDSLLRNAGHDPTTGRVELVTSARVMHYVFNPVNFFYCYDPGGELERVVVQVNNTFGEMHIYLLTDLLAERRGGELHYRADKVFHVSPFFDRVGRYDFYLSDISRGDLDITLHYRQEERIVFAARLTGTGRPLARWTVASKLLRHPLTATITMPRIIWQAARLRYQKHLPAYHKPPPSSPMTIRPAPPGLLARLGRMMTTAFLRRIESGDLTLVFPDGRRERYGESKGKRADIRVVDNNFFRRTLLRGGIGFGESYVAGEWNTSDLSGTLALLSENIEHLEEKHHRISSLGRSYEYLRHLLRFNTRAGSRRNIEAHYDLSNDFFALFLDPKMVYSCGIYKRSETTLEEAQIKKLRTVIEMAGITADDHVLEIGCGWGSFAMEAALTTGCRVTGITISREQLEFARKRVREAGLEEKVKLELRDYRHIAGTYDKVVSIEMLEAVGHAKLGTWFAACDRALKPGGKAVVQVITIPHERYDQYRRSSDWIRKHIFPGGHLPSMEAMQKAVERNSSLSIAAVESIGKHYVRTLDDWDRNLRQHGDQAAALGYDDRFLRKWEYYFAYCRAGFETGAIDNLQIILKKPERGTTQ